MDTLKGLGGPLRSKEHTIKNCVPDKLKIFNLYQGPPVSWEISAQLLFYSKILLTSHSLNHTLPAT